MFTKRETTFSIKKYTVGVMSVALGAVIALSVSTSQAEASEQESLLSAEPQVTIGGPDDHKYDENSGVYLPTPGSTSGFLQQERDFQPQVTIGGPLDHKYDEYSNVYLPAPGSNEAIHTIEPISVPEPEVTIGGPDDHKYPENADIYLQKPQQDFSEGFKPRSFYQTPQPRIETDYDPQITIDLPPIIAPIGDAGLGINPKTSELNDKAYQTEANRITPPIGDAAPPIAVGFGQQSTIELPPIVAPIGDEGLLINPETRELNDKAYQTEVDRIIRPIGDAAPPIPVSQSQQRYAFPSFLTTYDLFKMAYGDQSGFPFATIGDAGLDINPQTKWFNLGSQGGSSFFSQMRSPFLSMMGFGQPEITIGGDFDYEYDRFSGKWLPRPTHPIGFAEDYR